MSVIQFDRVSKSYPRYEPLLKGVKSALLQLSETIRSSSPEEFLALADVSLVIKKGETVGLIGSNGVGKSTLLGLIAGVLTPSKGQVGVTGRIAPLLELGAGFHFDLTGRENIVLNGVLLGLTRREVGERMVDIIAFSELGDSLDQPLRTYSTGMIARLGFSIAVHLSPEILLIDEVLSVGDLHFQFKCNDKIDAIRRQQVTMVIVSHSIEQIQRLCDRVIWLDAGRVVRDGAANAILPEYKEAMISMEMQKRNKIGVC